MIAVYLMTASVCLLFTVSLFPAVAGTKGERGNFNCDKPSLTLTAHLADSVTIRCTYPRAEKTNIKYFCKEEEHFGCTNVISTHTSNYTKRDRFSMTNNEEQGLYTVVISTLTQDDAGRYLCALKAVNNDSSIACLTEVHLRVLNWDDIAPTPKTHNTGETAHILCNYKDSYVNNTKHLCKGESPFSCSKLIQTAEGEKDVAKGRFQIRDNTRKKYFYVYIYSVSPADSGTYWCGFDTNGHHTEYTKIHLVVDEGHVKTKRSGPSSQQTPTAISVKEIKCNNHEDPNSDPGVIGGVVGCLALLVIVVIVLILFRHKLPRTQACCASGDSSQQSSNVGENTEATHGDHDYEEIHVGSQKASSRGAQSPVYAVANPPADQLHYASISIQKDSVTLSTDGKADTSSSSACDYSSISRTEGDTHALTLYSTVTKPGEP